VSVFDDCLISKVNQKCVSAWRDVARRGAGPRGAGRRGMRVRVVSTGAEALGHTALLPLAAMKKIVFKSYLTPIFILAVKFSHC